MLSSANFNFEGIQSALIAYSDGTLVEGWEYRDGALRVVAESMRGLIIEMEEEGVWDTPKRSEQADSHLSRIMLYLHSFGEVESLWKLEGTLMGLTGPPPRTKRRDQTEGGIFENGDDS